MSPAAIDARLDELVALGATHVALAVAWHQADVTAIAIAPGATTPPDDRVAGALTAATARGLHVVVFPILILDRTAPGQWRGTLAPRDIDRWWTAYERFILHYAAIAADGGAVALSVGSELGSTETWRDRWGHLIARARRAFTGELWYSANWDHFTHVSFTDRLDAIGVTGYFTLSDDPDADVPRLTASWQARAAELLAFAQARGRRLILTEVGYPSTRGALAAPWDYGRRGPVDLDGQRRAFAALAAAWDGRPLRGLFVWEWSGDGGAQDGGYTPRGKPAACTLHRWWHPAD